MTSPQKTNHPGAGNIAWSISRRLGMVVVLTLAFTLSAVVTIYTLFRSGDTRVPDVIGKNEVEAQQMAERAGLSVKIQRRNDPSVPANAVIETRPGPNASVKKSSALTIVVSTGPAQTKSQADFGERQLLPAGTRRVALTGGPAPLIPYSHVGLW